MQYTIVNYSYLTEITDFRIDAECYKPEHLRVERIIHEKDHKTIGEISSSVINFGAYSLCNYIEFLDEGIPFIVTEDIYNNIIDDSNFHYISEQIHKILYKSHCKKGQILLTMAGAYLGQAAIYNFDFSASSNQAIAKITLKNELIDSFYVSTFLNSLFGQSQIERFRTGTGQPNLNLGLIQKIKIPILTYSFQKSIRNVVLKGIALNNQSKDKYKQAEQILLSELGLLDWKPKHQLSFVRNYYDTKSAERIDAEYFQPMFNDIVEKFRKNTDVKYLADITSLIGHPSNPPYANDENKGKTFIITQKHLGTYYPSDNFWYDPESLYTTDEFIKKNRKYLMKKNDIILYSVGAYIGKANLYNCDISATIGSFLTLIRPKEDKVNPYYLLVFLNSEFGKYLTRRCSRGMAQQYVYPFDIKKFAIPIISEENQKEIEKDMLKALEAKDKSKSLLEIAKRGVELAIEENEIESEKWINEELLKCQVEISM
jgi:restriction endonuclease S subunit